MVCKQSDLIVRSSPKTQPMKTRALTLVALLTAPAISFAQLNPGDPADNGLIPRTDTFDVNGDQVNDNTESTGVGIAGNGNIIIGWEDDGAQLANPACRGRWRPAPTRC